MSAQTRSLEFRNITNQYGKKKSNYYTGVYILQMTRVLFPGRTDPAPKIFAIEGNLTPPN